MKEQIFLSKIEDIIGKEFIGDDCAYLKDMGIVVTQDSLVENVHFRRAWYTPFQLGYKAVAVNVSDITASGAKPVYATIAISLPCDVDEQYIEEFYKGASSCGVQIVGGDITGSEKDIMISVTAIGKTDGRKISSRKNAKEGYAVVVKGLHGSSGAGFRELMNGSGDEELILAHIKPVIEKDFADYIALNVNDDYAMMDTSDGLADALFKIAENSGVKFCIDYSKIPHLKKVLKNDVLFGGEDYKLVAAVPYDIAVKSGGTIIGNVEKYDGIRVDISGELFYTYDDIKAFNHFDNH